MSPGPSWPKNSAGFTGISLHSWSAREFWIARASGNLWTSGCGKAKRLKPRPLGDQDPVGSSFLSRYNGDSRGTLCAPAAQPDCLCLHCYMNIYRTGKSSSAFLTYNPKTGMFYEVKILLSRSPNILGNGLCVHTEVSELHLQGDGRSLLPPALGIAKGSICFHEPAQHLQV